MPAASTTNRLGAFDRIHQLLLDDAVALAQRLATPTVDPPAISAAEIQQLLDQHLADPAHPRNWQRQAIEHALSQPRAKEIYFRIKRSLWSWPEFTSLLPNARRILDAVVELARDEAFPWFVNVQADEILRLVCIDRKTFFDRLHDLECFTITRPARRITLLPFNEHESTVDRATRPHVWPSRENKFCVDPQAALLPGVPQWVIRYRRGIPYNKRRAAWWINYDLLCETQRVLPCFEMCLDTLPKNYFDRNRRLGAPGNFDTDAGFKVLERRLAKDGPLPPPGLRAALWDGLP